MPGEKLEHGIQDIYVLGEDEGLILKANEGFVDLVEGDKDEVCICGQHFARNKFQNKNVFKNVTGIALKFSRPPSNQCNCLTMSRQPLIYEINFRLKQLA